MADSVTAATLVAAVLEHQGMLAQGDFLVAFQEFFQYAGGLLYLVAAVFGLISFVTLGSFRAARYLLIGPALFWFLVGPTTEVSQGAAWKLGGGLERGIKAQEEATVGTQNEISEKLNRVGEKTPVVATGYWFFASTISEGVNQIVDFLLNDENETDLVVAGRVEALKAIADGVDLSPEDVQRIQQGFLKECSSMVTSAHAAASLVVKQKGSVAAQLAGAANGVGAEYQQSYDYHLANVRRFAEDVSLTTQGNGIGEIIKRHVNSASSFYPKTLAVDGKAPAKISCGDAWKLIAEMLWYKAGLGQRRILRAATNDQWVSTSTFEKQCAALTKKVVNGGGNAGELNGCNLQPAITLALVNQQLARNTVFNSVLKRHFNDSPGANVKSRALLSSGLRALGNTARPIAVNGLTLAKSIVTTVGRVGNGTVMESVSRNVVTHIDGVLKEFNIDVSQKSAMLVSSRAYMVDRIRQEVFSYGLRVPYYQGILLYIISVLYPFMALLVLIPSKAQSFLLIPMAYLWVKSWDIGFAAVILVDKILFNLLPSADVHPSLREGPWTSVDQLPRALAEGYNFDPLGSVYNYYSTLGFLWLSVPVITGYITLRAKRGVLASFTQGLTADAKGSGSVADSMFSMKAQNKMTGLLKELQGAARREQSLKGGFGGGAIHSVASSYGMYSAAATVVSSMVGGKSGSFKGPGPGVWGQAYESYNKAYNSIAQAEASLQSEAAGLYDSEMGVTSDLGIALSQYTAAMDGGGGFELYEQKSNIIKEMIGSEEARMDVEFDAISKLAAAGPAAIRNANGLRLSAGAGAAVGSLILSNSALNMLQAKSDAEILELGAQPAGYSREEYLASAMRRHPWIERSSVDKQKLARQLTPFTYTLFDVVNQEPAPAGFVAEAVVDNIVNMGGGNRKVREMTPAEIAQRQALEKSNIGSPLLQLDRKFKVSLPGEYEDDVRQRMKMLVALHGETEIKNYLRSIGKDPNRELFDAGVLPDMLGYLQSQEKDNSTFFKINNEMVSSANSNPWAVLFKLENWHKERGLPIPSTGTGAKQRSF